MAFAREHLLVTHTTGSPVRLALEVMVEGYDGEVDVLHAQVERNMSGDLIVKQGLTKRIFVGQVAIDDDVTGTIVYDSVTYTRATPALIKACIGKTDLQLKSFGDTVFWDAWITSDYAPKVVYEPTGDHRITPFEVVEK